MNEVSPVTTVQVTCTSEQAGVILKRVFKAAEILATVKQPQNFQTEARENRTKNRAQHELRYCKD